MPEIVNAFAGLKISGKLRLDQQEIGSHLINSGTGVLTEEGGNDLPIFGNPAYYRRFGFSENTARAFIPPYPLAYPFGWTGMMLNETPLPDTAIQFDCVAALSKPDLW